MVFQLDGELDEFNDLTETIQYRYDACDCEHDTVLILAKSISFWLRLRNAHLYLVWYLRIFYINKSFRQMSNKMSRERFEKFFFNQIIFCSRFPNQP